MTGTNPRLIITLPADLKAWLESKKEQSGASLAEIVRRELEAARKRDQEQRQ